MLGIFHFIQGPGRWFMPGPATLCKGTCVWEEGLQLRGETGFRNGVIGFWLIGRSQNKYCSWIWNALRAHMLKTVCAQQSILGVVETGRQTYREASMWPWVYPQGGLGQGYQVLV